VIRVVSDLRRCLPPSPVVGEKDKKTSAEQEQGRGFRNWSTIAHIQCANRHPISNQMISCA